MTLGEPTRVVTASFGSRALVYNMSAKPTSVVTRKPMVSAEVNDILTAKGHGFGPQGGFPVLP